MKEQKRLDVIYLFMIFTVGALLRLSLFRIQTDDYLYYLKVWVEKMKELGGFASLGYRLNNYTVPYTVFLAIISYIPYSSLYLIKLFSCAFDVLLALFSGKIIWERTENFKKSILAFTVIFFLPTVVMNSAAWGQCDVIYSLFLLLCMYCLFREKGACAMLFFGLAFSLKLQSVFLLPLIAFSVITRRIKVITLLEVPVIYFLSSVPALVAGRPLGDILFIYVSQSGNYPQLTLNYPNIYVFMGENAPSQFGMAGILWAMAVVGWFLYSAVKKEQQEKHLPYETLILYTIITGALMLWLLPHMHERYGYFFDVLIVIYAIIKPQKWYYALMWIGISTFSYLPYLTGGEVFPMSFLSVVQLGTIIMLIKEYTSPEKGVFSEKNGENTHNSIELCDRI